VRPTRATIAVVHPDHIRAEFAWSLMAMQAASSHELRIKTSRSGPNISRARNHLAQAFLDDKWSDWLLYVDTDMVLAPTTLDRLIDAADPDRRPVVGALCFYEATDGETRPTLYELTTDPVTGEQGLGTYEAWPDNQLMQVQATGTGCLLVHRTALLTVKRGYNGKSDTVWPWFREASLGSRQVGEDITFMMRLAASRIPVYVHTGIQVGHLKSTMLGKVQ
jgi:hypothetical protein